MSARSFPMSGVAAVSAVAIALAPSLTLPVAPAAAPTATQFSALLQPLEPDLLSGALVTGQLVPAVADAAILTPAAVAAMSIGEAIENLYNTVEPWVQYGFYLTSWAVGWVPFIGLLAPQIIFFYNLAEPIVAGLLFNSIEFLSGTISFGDALNNIGTTTTDAINTFINTEISWVESLLPPFPPIGASALSSLPLAATATGLVDPTAAADIAALPDGVAALNPATALDSMAALDPGAVSVFGELSQIAGVTGLSALSQIGADVGGTLLSLVP